MKEYTYNIINDVYNLILSKEKDIEVRILNEKSESIQIGDFITFNNLDKVGKWIKVQIIKKTIVNDLNELITQFEINRIMPQHTEKDLNSLMNKIYGEELVNKRIVAFEFKYLSSDLD